MAIDFVCAHCSKPYRVKDELAGKAAKCGQCGERMQIPQFVERVAKSPAAAQPTAASKTISAPSKATSAPKAPTAKAPAAAARAPSAAPKAPAAANTPAATKAPASRPAAAASANGHRPKQPPPPPQPQQKRPAATHDTVANVSSSSDTGSWLDDDLLATPAQNQPRSKDVACPKCGTRQPAGGMICGSCGEMLPLEAPVSNRPVLLKPLPAKQVEAPKKKKKRKKKLNLDMDSMVGLIKGTAFCIGFTFIAALLWAGVAVLMGLELRIIAVALGGMAGYGMALGHNNDNGLLAGIVAGFIAFCGIIGAKILIVIFLVATLVASGMGNLQREVVVQGIADEIIQQQGGNPANISLDQRERAVKTARAAVEAMDEAQIEAKYNELEAKWEKEAEAAESAEVAEGEGEASPSEDEAKAEEADAAAEVQDAAQQPQAPVAFDNAAMVEPEIEDSGSGSRGLFRFIDLLWIILAVGTAFKVGSGMGE